MDRTKHNYVVNYGNTGFLGGPSPYADSYYYGIVPTYQGVKFNGAPFTMSGCYKQYCSTPLPVKWTNFRDIRDGLSGTLMLSEAIQGRNTSSVEDLRGFIWWGNAAGFCTFLPPNSSQPDVYEQAAWCDTTNATGLLPCIGPYTTQQP